MMTRKTEISNLLNDLDDDETAQVAREALDLLGITQIVTLVLELDPTTKQELLEALADDGDAS